MLVEKETQSWWTKASASERITAIQSMPNKKQMTQKMWNQFVAIFGILRRSSGLFVAQMKDNQDYTTILMEIYITLKCEAAL